MLALLAAPRLLPSHAGESRHPPPPPSSDALRYLSCVSSFGSGMATGPAIGRSPARLCADAANFQEAPGLRPGAFCVNGTPADTGTNSSHGNRRGTGLQLPRLPPRHREKRTPMVVVMTPEATQADVDGIVDVVRDAGGEAFVTRGVSRTIVGLVGDVDQFGSLNLRSRPGVLDVVRISVPYKLVSREHHPNRSVVQLV